MWVIVELNRDGDVVEVHNLIFTDLETAKKELNNEY